MSTQEKIKEQWIEVGDTEIFTTGYYVVSIGQVRSVIRSESIENEDQLAKIDQRKIATAVLDSDYRISFHFFPVENNSRYLMEGMASRNAIDNILSQIPPVIKKVLTQQRPVRYFAI